jgi:hypothetical protein
MAGLVQGQPKTSGCQCADNEAAVTNHEPHHALCPFLVVAQTEANGCQCAEDEAAVTDDNFHGDTLLRVVDSGVCDIAFAVCLYSAQPASIERQSLQAKSFIIASFH